MDKPDAGALVDQQSVPILENDTALDVSFKVAAAAEQANIHTLGVTGSAGGLAQKVNIVSVELDMYPTFKAYVDAVNDGSFGKKFFVSGLANHGLILTRVNEIDKRVPADLQKQVDALVGQLASGAKTLPDFYGPAK